MEHSAIIGAKYLITLSPLLGIVYFLHIPREKKRRFVVFFLVSLPLTYILGVIARELHFNPRPFVVGSFEPLVPHAPDNGFPSDHTLLAAALAAGMLYFSTRTATILWVIAGLVAASRVYAGVHHPIDILASVLIALVAACAVHIFLRRKMDDIMQETPQPSPGQAKQNHERQ